MNIDHIVLNLMNMTKENEQLGNRLRLARRAKGLTQKELAALVGADQTYISHIENGDTSGSVKLLKQITKELGISLAQLHGESKTKLSYEALSEEAFDLARDWQKLSPDQQVTIRATINALLKQKQSRKRKK